jgi:hypothetical protein
MTHRIHLNLGAREFEVEGSAEFVERHASRLEELFASNRATQGDAPSPPAPSHSQPRDQAETFGEALQAVASSAGTDRFLLAGSFVQAQSEDRLFTTREANELLKEQAVKLGNPSQTAANLLSAKMIFREKGKFRVSRQGEERLKQLREH